MICARRCKFLKSPIIQRLSLPLEFGKRSRLKFERRKKFIKRPFIGLGKGERLKGKIHLRKRKKSRHTKESNKKEKNNIFATIPRDERSSSHYQEGSRDRLTSSEGDGKGAP